VRVYAGTDPRMPLRDVPACARRVEAMGFDGVHVAEVVHDSLGVALLFAEHTDRMVVRTSVTLAFPRSPTATAYAAWDLAAFSGGRFQLGLGTQIRQNIEGRYGVPWTDPVERMREYVEALAAVYRSFATGERPDYQGRQYRLSRMQPFFNPGPLAGLEAPPTYLGGVNAGICQLAGELAAGFVTHPTNSDPRYLAEVCLPNLRAGAERGGRDLAAFELVVGSLVITGPSRVALDDERERQRRVLAFLYSTPAYERTLELYGWVEIAGRLREMIRADRWDELHNLVTDEVLDTLVPTATYQELPKVLHQRYGSVAQAVLLHLPPGPAHDAALAEAVRGIQTLE
jgi:probable F420-dependent oxidoreductase